MVYLNDGCESWNISQAMQERLEAVEIWFLKMDRMTNEAILRNANTERALMNMITARKLRFLGHINRKEVIEYNAMTGKIEGKRTKAASLEEWEGIGQHAKYCRYQRQKGIGLTQLSTSSDMAHKKNRIEYQDSCSYYLLFLKEQNTQ